MQKLRQVLKQFLEGCNTLKGRNLIEKINRASKAGGDNSGSCVPRGSQDAWMPINA
jgi:hypothetical protein